MQLPAMACPNPALSLLALCAGLPALLGRQAASSVAACHGMPLLALCAGLPALLGRQAASSVAAHGSRCTVALAL
jgi:hypothetical protein